MDTPLGYPPLEGYASRGVQYENGYPSYSRTNKAVRIILNRVLMRNGITVMARSIHMSLPLGGRKSRKR